MQLEHCVSCARRERIWFKVVQGADGGYVCSLAFRGPIPSVGSDTIIEGAEQRFETAAVVIKISTDTKHRVKAVRFFLGVG